MYNWFILSNQSENLFLQKFSETRTSLESHIERRSDEIIGKLDESDNKEINRFK